MVPAGEHLPSLTSVCMDGGNCTAPERDQINLLDASHGKYIILQVNLWPGMIQFPK
jgi:hypothetical protein